MALRLGLLALSGEACGARGIDLRLRNLPGAVRVHATEQSFSMLRAVLGHPIVEPRLKGGDFVLGDESVVVQVEAFELLLNAGRNVGAVLVRREETASSMGGGWRCRGRGPGSRNRGNKKG